MTLKSSAIRTTVITLLAIDLYALPSLVFANLPATPRATAQPPTSSCGCSANVNGTIKPDANAIRRLVGDSVKDSALIGFAAPPKCANLPSNCSGSLPAGCPNPYLSGPGAWKQCV